MSVDKVVSCNLLELPCRLDFVQRTIPAFVFIFKDTEKDRRSQKRNGGREMRNNVAAGRKQSKEA